MAPETPPARKTFESATSIAKAFMRPAKSTGPDGVQLVAAERDKLPGDWILDSRAGRVDAKASSLARIHRGISPVAGFRSRNQSKYARPFMSSSRTSSGDGG